MQQEVVILMAFVTSCVFQPPIQRLQHVLVQLDSIAHQPMTQTAKLVNNLYKEGDNILRYTIPMPKIYTAKTQIQKVRP